MAVLSDYTDGTITVTNGQTAFTGTNTLWRSAAFREGDTVQLHGLTAIIAGTNADDPLIASNTSGEFTEPWTGESGTFSYRMRYMPDNARFSAKSQTLINKLDNGVLDSIAETPVEPGNLLIGDESGLYVPIAKSDLGIQDPNGNLGDLAALTLAARQILQTDQNGALKAIALVANKALVTDANADTEQIDLGTLGRTLLALAAGTNAQYVQGDGSLATLNKTAVGLGNVDNTSDAAKPVSTATQTALNGKLGLAGGQMTGDITFRKSTPAINFVTPDNSIGYRMMANIANGIDYGWHVGAGFAGSELFIVRGNGTVSVPGAFSAGSKSFQIDHPKDPYNKDLVFMSTEAPKAGVEFWGTVYLMNGKAEVDIDAASNMSTGTFAALTQNAIVVSVNNLDEPTHVHASRIVDGKFTLQADGNGDYEVSWLVKAERADPFIKSHPWCDPETGILIPEQEKDDA